MKIKDRDQSGNRTKMWFLPNIYLWQAPWRYRYKVQTKLTKLTLKPDITKVQVWKNLNQNK